MSERYVIVYRNRDGYKGVDMYAGAYAGPSYKLHEARFWYSLDDLTAAIEAKPELLTSPSRGHEPGVVCKIVTKIVHTLEPVETAMPNEA